MVLLFFPVIYGCDALYRVLDKEGAEEKQLIGEVVPFEPNATIEEIQQLLSLYGFNPGPADGQLGLRTRNAIERFQQENGLKETRFVDQATWERLKQFKDNQFVVDNHLNIAAIQSALKAAGYSLGKIDGKLGKKTKQAVLDFQKANGLKVDGKVGYHTLSKLSAYVPAME